MSAIVFGGARGIGAAIVEQLGHRGYWNPVIIDKVSHPSRDTIIASFPLVEEGAAAELADFRSLSFREVYITFGRPTHRKFDETDNLKEEQLWAGNFGAVTSALRICRPFLFPDSSIVITSSVSASTADPGGTIYAAAKAGLEAVVRGLAREWAPVRVNAIAPGPTSTEQFMEKVPATNRMLEAGRSPHHVLITPQQVAFAATRLAEMTGVSGVVLPVDLAGQSSSRRM